MNHHHHQYLKHQLYHQQENLHQQLSHQFLIIKKNVNMIVETVVATINNNNR